MKKYILHISYFFFFIADYAGCQFIKPKSDLIIWNKQPATNWNEALPVGNGKLGAMVFGKPIHERIQLNEQAFWVGCIVEDANPNVQPGAVKSIQSLILDNKIKDAIDLANKTIMSKPEAYTTIRKNITCLRVEVSFSEFYIHLK